MAHSPWVVIWSFNMNIHVLPEYVVSIKLDEDSDDSGGECVLVQGEEEDLYELD